MAGFLHDDIVCNILVHLPAKSLLRFMCVSTHWNRLLKEPNFMKLRSRKIIIIPVSDALHLIDDKMPTEDTTNFIVNRCYPIKKQTEYVRVVGTFNGIVLLRCLGDFVLYNPFTGARKRLPSAPTFSSALAAYGFGYGANSDDLKIVKFILYYEVCDVYNLKEGSWSSWSTSKYNIGFSIAHENVDGTFANGFLYWIASSSRNVFIVLDVKDMVLSEMYPPFVIDYHLGTINGSLCALRRDYCRIDMWVMKEHNQWSKIYSFNLPWTDTLMNSNPLYILDSGRILMVSNASSNLIIYDPSLDSLKISGMCFRDRTRRSLEYVESLVSPSDIISSSRLERLSKEQN